MKSEFFNHNSKPSYALMSTISGHESPWKKILSSTALRKGSRNLTGVSRKTVVWHNRL